jgi:hypothetical protein
MVGSQWATSANALIMTTSTFAPDETSSHIMRCREQKCLDLLNLQISKIREHFRHTVLSHTHSFTGATITNSSSSNIIAYRKKQQESTHTKKKPAGRQSRTPRQTNSNHSRPEHAVTGSVGPSSKTSYSPMPTQC